MVYYSFQTKSPYLITGFGTVLFVIAAVHHTTELYAVESLIGPVVAFILDGVPALGLAYAGYWISNTELSPEECWQVWVWCFAGASLFVIIMGLSILVRAFEGRVIGEALFPLLIAAETGGIAGVVGGYQTARARTETRRAQSVSGELRERTRQLQGVLDAVEAAIWIRDTDSRFVLVNQTFRELFDVDDEMEITGMPPEKVLPQKVAKQFREDDQRVLEAEQPVEIEETVDTEHGERTFLTRITPLVEDDDLYAMCGIASDITEQKEYERTIEQQNERLEQFASVVSHDLRNPLNVAEGRLELAREECDSEHLEDVRHALDRMRALIEDLLTLARGDETDTDLEPINLRAIFTDCWSNVETKNATLDTHIDRTVYADRSRLKQVFENLIRNAIDHGDDDVTVTIGELDDGFYIEDDGPGIPEDERDEVFNAGYSTSDEGTGFGLNIVKQVVNAHDWEIRVTAGSEGGARFEITGVESVGGTSLRTR